MPARRRHHLHRDAAAGADAGYPRHGARLMNSTAARILVVDDEKLIRWSVSERLQRDGYVVATAESGEQALDAVVLDPPDLVLLDVKLPGANGVETLQRLLALQPDMTVIMMSAHSAVDVAVDAM